MKAVLCMLSVIFLLLACEQAKEAGDETARELTGSNMIERGNAMKQQIKTVEQQQKQNLQQLEE